MSSGVFQIGLEIIRNNMLQTWGVIMGLKKALAKDGMGL